MAEYQKFLFDNFVLSNNEDPAAVIEIPETDTAVTVPAEADNTENTEVIAESETEVVAEPLPESEIFIPEEPKVELPPVIQGYTEEEVAEKIRLAESVAYQKGRDDAAAAAAENDGRLLVKIDEELSKVLGDYATLKNNLEEQFRSMAAALVRRLVPTLLEENALELVSRFLEENFKNFAAEPKLSFYFNPDMIGKVQEIIGRMAHVFDFEGKITLHKDSSLALGDCRVEWENGGVERNSADMLDKAVKMLDTE